MFIAERPESAAGIRQRPPWRAEVLLPPAPTPTPIVTVGVRAGQAGRVGCQRRERPAPRSRPSSVTSTFAVLTGPPVTWMLPAPMLLSASRAAGSRRVRVERDRGGRLPVERQRERAAGRVRRRGRSGSRRSAGRCSDPSRRRRRCLRRESSPVTNQRLPCLSQSMSPATWQHAPRLTGTRMICCSLARSRCAGTPRDVVDELEPRQLEVADPGSHSSEM